MDEDQSVFIVNREALNWLRCRNNKKQIFDIIS